MEEAGLKLVAEGAGQFFRDMDRAGQAVDTFARETERGASRAGSGFSGLQSIAQGVLQGIGQGLVGLATTAATSLFDLGKGLLQTGIDLNAAQEQATVAFTTLLGSGEKAKSFLDELRAFAAATPFEFPELQDAARKMLSFGFSAEQVTPLLTSVGDAVSALGGGAPEMDRVTMALGQMQTKGKASNEELLQLAEVGLPVYQILAERLGVTTAEVQDLVSKGIVPADEAIAALTDGFNELYGGSMQAQSATFNGLMSTLKDNASLALQAFTGPMFEAAKGGLTELGSLVASPKFQEFAGRLGELVAPAVEGLAKAFSGAVTVASAFIDALSGDKAALDKLPGTLQTIVGAVAGIPAAFDGAKRAVEAFFKTPLGSAIKDAASSLADYLANDFGPDVAATLEGGRQALDEFFSTPLGTEIREGAQVVADYFAGPFVSDLTRGVQVVQGKLDELAQSEWGQTVQRGAQRVGDYIVNEWPGDFQRGVAVVQGHLDRLSQQMAPWGQEIQRGANVVAQYMMNDFPADFGRGVDLVVDLILNLPARAQEGLDGLVRGVQALPGEVSSAATAVGAAIIDGIVGGIRAGIAWVTDAARAVAQAAVEAAKKALKIGSPSKLFAEEVGQPISQGIAEGVMAEAQAVQGWIEFYAGQVFEGVEEEVQRHIERLNRTLQTGIGLVGGMGSGAGAIAAAAEKQFKLDQAVRDAYAKGDAKAYQAALDAARRQQALTNTIVQAQERTQREALSIGEADPERGSAYLAKRLNQLQEVADLEERIAQAQAQGNSNGVALLSRQLGLVRERQGIELQSLATGASDQVRQVISGVIASLLASGGSSSTTVNNYSYTPTYAGAPANPSQDFAAMRLLSA